MNSVQRAWQVLALQSQTLAPIADLFKADSQRFKNFSIQNLDILFDFSKQRLHAQNLLALEALAVRCDLQAQIQGLFKGDYLNTSEKKPVLHTALRDPTTTPLWINGLNFKIAIQYQLERLGLLVEKLRTAQYLGVTQAVITDVLYLGIGGSMAGPKMACRALANVTKLDSMVRCHFVSNIDGQTLASTLRALQPAKTLCVISSKTGTTLETLENAQVVAAWLRQALGAKFNRHLIAITANVPAAVHFGINEENIFEIWPAIGGRFSLWSSVGLPIALSIGMENFKDFLAGGYAMDQHFQSAPFLKNMPVLLALLGIWNINFLNYSSHALIPYEDDLCELPTYLQQLEMESNGKQSLHSTAPIIWGGVGCDAQHTFMQLLHQGTTIVPIDFLVATQGHPDFKQHQQWLVAHCLAQSKALMEGTGAELAVDSPAYCPGNRPSTTLMYPCLTPKLLGTLIALYEHKVFVQGVIWGINSFDQWGVALGKQWVKKIFPVLASTEQRLRQTPIANETAYDHESPWALESSTQGLADYFKISNNINTI